MKRLLYFTAIVIACMLTGCSPYALVNSEVYNNANLADITTYRIVTPDDGKLPPGMMSVTYYNIAAAIREQMAERGYREDPLSSILVNFGISVHKELQTEPMLPPNYFVGPYAPPYPGPYPGYYPYFIYPRSYYWNYYSNAQVITGIYREGVLTMDIVNVASKEALYSASVATIMDNGNTNFRNLQGIAQAVSTLFSKYPVKPISPAGK